MKRSLIYLLFIALSFTTLSTQGQNFSFGVSHTVNNNSLNGIALADVDNDGDLDLAVSSIASNNVRIRKNNGDGTFAAPAAVNLSNATKLQFRDVDGDNDPDLIVLRTANSIISILKNDGTGTFFVTANLPAGGGNNSDFDAGDFDSDGDIDLAVNSFMNHDINVLYNFGNGTFTPFVSFTANNPGTIIVYNSNPSVDLDLDLVFINNNGFLDCLPNNGLGNFNGNVIILDDIFGLGVCQLFAGDLNGDNKGDLVTVDLTANCFYVNLHQGVGNNHNTSLIFTTGIGPIDAQLSDLDGDNDLDIVTANSTSANLTLRANNGLGNFAGTALTLPTGQNPSSIAAGDLDNDGDNDLIVTHNSVNNMIVYINDRPRISDITNQLLIVPSTGQYNFTLPLPTSNLVLSASSSDQVIIPNTNLSFSGMGTNRILQVQSVVNQTGVTVIAVTGSNTVTGITAQDTFNLTVIDTNIIIPPGDTNVINPGNINPHITGFAIDLKKPKLKKTKVYKSLKGFGVKVNVITSNTINDLSYATISATDTNLTNIAFVKAGKRKDITKGKLKKKGVAAVFKSKGNNAGIGMDPGTTSVKFIVKIDGTQGTNVGSVFITNVLNTKIK